MIGLEEAPELRLPSHTGRGISAKQIPLRDEHPQTSDTRGSCSHQPLIVNVLLSNKKIHTY